MLYKVWYEDFTPRPGPIHHGVWLKGSDGRWCEVDGHYHGPWYECEHFPPEVIAEIRRARGMAAFEEIPPDPAA